MRAAHQERQIGAERAVEAPNESRVNHPVKLVMTSQDVIHDFYVPAFRTKQDVLPGRYTSEWFTPTKPGTYSYFCSIHPKMTGQLIVQ